MHLVSISPPELFQALSDPTRLRVMRLLAKSREESCLCELADSLSLPDFSLSRHLKVLRQVGLLAAVKEGRWVYHRVAKGPPYLDDVVALICSLPDPDKVFARDLARFNKCVSLRADGRCRGREALPVANTASRRARGDKTRNAGSPSR
jgi:ArsR family transcriptional regulator